MLVALLALAPSLASAQQPPTCDAEVHRQFDFWIGDWTVKFPNGKPAGENTIERILDGCVLLENWTGTSGSTGKSFNLYDRTDGKWHQTWVDNSGARLVLVGGLDESGRMVMIGESPAQSGGTALHEISWTLQEDGSVIQHWRSSLDGGEFWSDLFVGTYVPKS